MRIQQRSFQSLLLFMFVKQQNYRKKLLKKYFEKMQSLKHLYQHAFIQSPIWVNNRTSSQLFKFDTLQIIKPINFQISNRLPYIFQSYLNQLSNINPQQLQKMPLWLILVLVGLGILYYFKNNKKQQLPEQHQEKVISQAPKMDMTFEQLKNYSHSNDKFVFVALKGIIYDVSSSDFYKPPSGYALFSGHDASVNLAKMSHEAQYLNKYGQVALTSSESQTLDDWVSRFQQKYPVVGKVLS